MSNKHEGVGLYLSLNGNQDTFDSSDTIEGVITVKVTKPIQCKELIVSNQYRVEGIGKPVEKEVSSKVVFSGNWQAGDYHYPFTFSIPSEQGKNSLPTSYDGHHIYISWFIAVSAVTKPKSHSYYEMPYELVKPVRQLEKLDTNLNEFNETSNFIVSIMFILPFILGSFISVMQDDLLWSVICIVLSIVLTLMAFIPSGRNRFGSVELIIDDMTIDNTEIEDTIIANVTITPKKDITVDWLTAYLILEEYTTDGFSSGGQFSRDRRVLDTNEISNKLRVSLTKDTSHSFTIPLKISKPLAPHLDLHYNKLTYQFKLVAVVEGKEEVWWHKVTIT